MSRVSWLNAALAAAVAVLAALAYYKPFKETQVEYPLSELTAREAYSIRIERAGTPDILIEKKGGSWFLAAPLALRGDDAKVQRLLEIVEAKSAYRLAASDLARFELDRPQARVSINGQVFGFGMVNPTTREQYVLRGDAVYAVHLRYGAALPATALGLASPRLLAPDEMPVRIALKEFSVEQQGGRWTAVPGAEALSQDDLIRWVEAWQLASALRVESRSRGKPLAEIAIQLKGGRSLLLGVIAREPGLVLARPDEKLEYHFSADTAKRLLTPPSAREEQAAKK